MKKRLLILGAISSLLVVSCRKDAKTLTISKEIKVESEQILPLKVAGLNELTLRASTSEDDPIKTIHTLSFLFFSGEDGAETLSHIKTENISESNQLEHINLRLPKGNYKLVAFANLPDGIKKMINPGARLSDVLDYKVLSTSSLMTYSSESVQGILMGNEQGPIAIRQEVFVSEVSKIGSRTQVSLEPSMARVLVWGNPIVSNGRLGAIPPKYIINNLPKSIKLLRPLASLKGGQQERAGDNSNRRDRYAGSSLMDAQGEGTNKWASLVGNWTKAMYTTSAVWVSIPQSLADYKTRYHEKGIYAKEATLPEGAYLQGLTPCVVIALPYIPQGLNLTGDEGWVDFRGQYLSETAFRQGLSNNFPNNPALREAVRTANIVEGDFAKGFSKGEINFFHKSVSYYISYIKHFELEAEGAQYGKYGIVRGNEYRLELKYVSGAGSPIPQELAGNTNPIVEVSSLGTSVSVAPITERDQIVEM